MNDTKSRILDAAEKLFAEEGFDGASLRAITSAAGVNLAAVNYHFSSKESLLEAVFARKLAPLNERRLALLDTLEAEAAPDPVPIEKLVHAFVEPAVRLLEAPTPGSLSFGVLLGRMYATPGPSVRNIFAGELRPFVRRFYSAFRRSLPALSPADITWRVFFSVGAMSQVLAAGWLLPVISEGRANIDNVDDIVARLTGFMVAGLKARADSPVAHRSDRGPRSRRAGNSGR